MNDLLTINEFAEIVGKKPQGIHKQATNENSRLFPYVVQQMGKRYIKKEALTEIYQINQTNQPDQSTEANENNQTNQPDQSNQSTEPIKPINPQADPETIEFYREIIRGLQSQIQEKDKQIAEKDKQIEKRDSQIDEKDRQIAELFKVLDHQQQLHAQSNYLADKKPIAELEQPGQEEEKPKKKRNAFMRWLFGEE